MIKEDLLAILEAHREQYVSGAKIAKELSVSRAAVWKAIGQLKEEGFIIDSATNKGYRLSENSDVLRESGIRKYLRKKDVQVRTEQVVTSTNTILKEEAKNGQVDSAVLVAAEQTAGRGRIGRSFYSPQGTGIYLSILLRPKLSAEQALKITICAAVATAEAIEQVSGEKTEIKWVNDIRVRGKKICGILTEASMDCETGGMEYAIVGIGINLMEPKGGFPEEICDIAGALFSSELPKDIRCRIAAEIIDRFFRYYDALPEDLAYQSYTERSCVLGKKVTIMPFTGEPVKAEVLEIDRDYALIVRDEEGGIRRINSGEVSLRDI